MASHYDLIWRLLFQFFIVLVLVFAVVGFATGIGLIVASARTFRVFQVMNRWISTRGALKSMEIPRDTEQLSHRHRRRIGWALIAGGIFASLGLLFGVDPAAFGAVTARGDMRTVAAIVAGTVKWFLFVGSLAGVLVGYLLCFSPNALATLEKFANRWISPRRALRGGDDEHLTLDKLVEAHPGQAGWILACTALGAVIYAATLLVTRL
jgi:hypothetical protein